jgi:hypothetical protein
LRKQEAQNAKLVFGLANLCLCFIQSVQVKKSNEENPPDSKDPFNYFNYFTEVEEEFVRRRGKPLFISPMDWALIETWKTAGIPLHIVLRAINESFDAYDARERKFRKVNSIFYCEQTVESMFADYRLSQVGASPTATQSIEAEATAKSTNQEPPAASIFPKETLLEFLDNSYKDLAFAESFAREQQNTALIEAIKRARKRLRVIAEELENSMSINDQGLEHDLDAIDRMILKSIEESLNETEKFAIRQEAEAHLKVYKKKMDKKIFEQTLHNYISRRLRETHRIPRLSLFYI